MKTSMNNYTRKRIFDHTDILTNIHICQSPCKSFRLKKIAMRDVHFHITI